MKPATLRFFLLIARPGSDAVALALVLVAFAVYIGMLGPTAYDQVFGIALLLQMFAASTGYRDRLRRGHFDPVLVGRASHWRIAAAHWVVSAGLGVAVWVVLTLIEVIVRPRQWPNSLAPAEIATLLYISTAAWAITLPLPRYTGALAWLLLLIVLLAAEQLAAMRVTFNPAPDTWTEALGSASRVFVFPFLLVFDPAAAGARLLAVMAIGTGAVWVFGATLIRQFEASLVEDR